MGETVDYRMNFSLRWVAEWYRMAEDKCTRDALGIVSTTDIGHADGGVTIHPSNYSLIRGWPNVPAASKDFCTTIPEILVVLRRFFRKLAPEDRFSSR